MPKTIAKEELLAEQERTVDSTTTKMKMVQKAKEKAKQLFSAKSLVLRGRWNMRMKTTRR